ncbi:MAG TPA: bifunctional nuclease family protein [Planctomycetes bacterium]|nr:bifunctional nuclease family protein [Planctomycetota bacterium]HIK61437.1 bifunctional nuclease family protein [Planctomycetota bacterium]
MSDEPMTPVRLSRLVLRDDSDQQWLFLTERDGERTFPIVIGNPEASEIQRILANEEHPRPLTHQLAFDAIAALGAKLARVEIVDLRENTFFARLVLTTTASEEDIRVDARPSDALALAMRAGCPIHVAESVLEQARSDTSGPDSLPNPDEGAGPSPDDSGEPGEPDPPNEDLL